MRRARVPDRLHDERMLRPTDIAPAIDASTYATEYDAR